MALTPTNRGFAAFHPDNDFFQLRADDMRDERSYRRRIAASAKKLANNIETAIAKQATEMGSLVVHDARSDDSIRLLSQPIPVTHELFAGMKTQSFTIPGVGINGIFATQGDISTLTGLCRIAVWYSACAVRPEAIVVGLPNQTAP